MRLPLHHNTIQHPKHQTIQQNHPRRHSRLQLLVLISLTSFASSGESFVLDSILATTRSKAASSSCFLTTTLSMTAPSSKEHQGDNTDQPISSISNNSMNARSSSSSQSWRSLLEISMAKTRKIRGSNYVQLATVNTSREPRVRTVVFRGCLTVPKDHALSNTCHDTSSTDNNPPLSCLLKMCTDARSQKVEDNANQSTAELCWWFPKTSEQYRIRGELILVGTEEDDRALTIARKELWGNLSDPARESFLDTTHTPGQQWNDSHDESTVIIDIPKGGRDDEGKVVPPPDNFLLMLLNPSYCDYLCLSGNQYRQIDVLRNGQWSWQRVNP
ncbi:pyridoxamine 5'-phosphate oxidase-like FMN-binding protein [Nitzschia inconspicua]|uniref:Pyridoxamine 5'-phosphate oxidase-like FMN-binding protein n=1 Tax=Nitzschia inconspicua TaxID=303405 RepID=A0A9K3KDQ3_9STRA|nr:pyridoxamine 5'-phosphate oxidase-like FMN-binding protein [Nitzschia inconspicua]